MELDEASDDRGRLTRILLSGALAVVAIASFRRGRRLTGALTAAGAVALGYATVSDTPDPIETGDTADLGTEESAAESTVNHNRMRCAICDEAITVGQARRPNADHETVHDACLETAQ